MKSLRSLCEKPICWILCLTAVARSPAEGQPVDSFRNWQLKPEQSLYLSATMTTKSSQAEADMLQLTLDEYFNSESGRDMPRIRLSNPSPPWRLELKTESDRFVITEPPGTPPPIPERPENWPEEAPWPPPRPPQQKYSFAAGVANGTYWEITPGMRSITFNTNLFEMASIRGELMAIKSPGYEVHVASKIKNLGFPMFPGKMTWNGNVFEGVDQSNTFKGEVQRSSDGRVISAYYDRKSLTSKKTPTCRWLLQYTYPDNDPKTWIPSSFTRQVVTLDDGNMPSERALEYASVTTVNLEKFEIREEPFPDSDFDPLTYYVGDTNQLRYEFISGNVTNYFSVVEDERQRRAAEWRKKMIRNRIVFGVILGFFGIVIYFAIYGSPWKQWKRWRSGKGWWP